MISGQKKENTPLMSESAYDVLKREKDFLKGPQAPVAPRLSLTGMPAPILEPNVPRLTVAPPPPPRPAAQLNRNKSGIKDPSAYFDR